MMMKHVSVFYLKEECRTPENVELIANMLRKLPSEVETITACEIGVKPFPMPTVSPDGNVDFYDIIQIITFASEADCQGYPMTAGHQKLLAETKPYIEKVVGIDYPVEA